MRRTYLWCLALTLFAVFESAGNAQTVPAFPFTYYVHDTTGLSADYPLTSTYQFASTSVGTSTNLAIKAVNTSNSTAYLAKPFVSTLPNSTVLDQNFAVGGFTSALIIPAGASTLFQLTFHPPSQGVFTAYLQTSYQVSQNGCSFTSSNVNTQCPGGLNISATLMGSGTQIIFPFSYYTYTGSVANTTNPLPSTYQFPATAVGSTSQIQIYAVNTSTTPALLADVFVTDSATSNVISPNYAIKGLDFLSAVPAGAAVPFTVTFNPIATGLLTAYLKTTYQVQAGGCMVGSTTGPACPGGVNTSILTGIGSPAQLALTYTDSSGTAHPVLSTSAVNFGNGVPAGQTVSFLFTLSNKSSIDLPIPTVDLQTPQYQTSSFVLSGVPQGIIPAGKSITFKVAYTAADPTQTSATLLVGTDSYTLQGTSVGNFNVSYSSGPMAGSNAVPGIPIQFGQFQPGSNGNIPVTFTITNASGYSNTLSTISLSGAGFAPAGVPTLPTQIPSTGLNFVVMLTPSSYVTTGDSLTIDGETFPLTYTAPASQSGSLSGLSFAVNPSPLTSQQSPTLTVQLDPALSSALLGNVGMTFTPSVVNAKDDAAIHFLNTNSREVFTTVSAGSQVVSATYPTSNSLINFQTGTTAGTITFTANFPSVPPYLITASKQYTISPALIQITSTSAVRSEPSLLVKIIGYDNTYSAGKVTFTFSDTSGNAFAPIVYDATSVFQSWFFTDTANPGGGAFVANATFSYPDKTSTIGSVAVSITNSVGTTSTTINFTN